MLLAAAAPPCSRLHLSRTTQWQCAASATSSSAAAAIDVTTLGNLCVDIVLNVPQLPPSAPHARLSYMRQLESQAPEQSCWEAGGISNFSIAAARLGLECSSLGHVGNDSYGDFLTTVLESEGARLVRLSEDGVSVTTGDYDGSTLVCWVLVDPSRRHDFCSRFDFNKTPVLDKVRCLPPRAEATIRRSKALLLNGFVFDELLPSLILSAVDCAHDSGNAVFFDPGPRGETLFAEDRSTLEQLLSLSDVLLLTAEEARTLTGFEDPERSARTLLDSGKRTKWVVVKLGADGSLMADAQGVHRVPGFEVDVIDTVGCGDSFAAAAVIGYNGGLAPTTTLALANAVGAATAMGCGAGRNVATLAAVHEVLSSRATQADTDAKSVLNRLAAQRRLHMSKSQV